MENKINLVEILKDCPQGMELDCTMFDDVTFYGVSNEEAIVAKRELVNQKLYLDSYGAPFVFPKEDSKCVIFPKGKTTWEGFVPPCKFKAGDVIVTRAGDIGIIKERAGIKYLVNCTLGGSSLYTVPLMSCIERLATKEEKKKLLQAIKNAGYKLNEETKTLEKLIKPKFKVGDNIRIKGQHAMYVVTELREDRYMLDDKDLPLLLKNQDQWELVPNKFDITTLVPFESRVLVREGKADVWQPSYYGFLNQRIKRFYTTTNTWLMCIPYNEDTKHLIGTTNDCEEFYKTWEEKA